jgi:uncharacterized circularly permuted ATP-grasp superfamily protein/uncharacterized alpha-E superfamily protein
MTVDLYQTPLRFGAAYDELSADGVTPRPHWRHLMESLEEIGDEELGRRWARAERRIRENGITYNIYGDPQGADRPWKIDLIPFLIPAQEWRFLEAGIVQRAQLLSLVLEDLYGAQELLASGRFPAALLYGNPAFLRPLVGVKAPSHGLLHMLAVDLARSPEGRWWVLADRTQAPSGSGYALENRTIVSDVLPDLFRTSEVLRLAPFFRAQRDALTSLSPKANPRIVLLTPGPFNETYFEHSYIARYLGFTLVEGADLTVRDRCVFLKTVAGLEQVDVILRRVDDSFCDPLELRSDSLLGVPGLVDAIVAGNVQVANGLGSGLIETAAVMPFLPGLARHLLGEELKLPSVATWWCGQSYALEWVLEHLDEVVVKPAFPAGGVSGGMEPVFGAEISPADKSKLAERLRARPHEYVAQEQVTLSTAPVWENGHVDSRSLVLRAYVLNTGSGWMAIPGGLVRVAEGDAEASGKGTGKGSVVSMQRGGHSKDAWVLWDSPVDTFSMLRPRGEPVELRRTERAVPSSVADNVFWLGRYVERAENIARMARTMIPRVLRADAAEFGCLLRLHGCLETRYGKLPRSRTKLPDAPNLERDLELELISLVTDPRRPDSLASTLREIARVGGRVRERLSADMTFLIVKLRDSVPDASRDAVPAEAARRFLEYPAMLTACLELLSAFSGMERENVTRGLGWLFLSIGRRLERAIFLARQLREVTTPLAEQDWPLLECLLEVADSSMAYRTRYYTTLQPLALLDVLMADEKNPRSLDFQLSHLLELYEKLPRTVPEDLKAMQEAIAELRGFDLSRMSYPLPGTVAAKTSAAGLANLDRFLRGLENLLPTWSNNLSSTYFSHARALPITIGE